MRILSIGNSFSEDAQHWLRDLAGADGTDLNCVNLFIGGCSLEAHCCNLDTGEKSYDYVVNGCWGDRKVSIEEALKEGNWDVITLQQVSQDCGLPLSYEPYFGRLLAFVRSYCPDAKIYIHETWAYETDSDHERFCNYDCDQELMYRFIVLTSEHFSKKYDLEIIPVGEAVQYCRNNIKEFDYRNGGASFNRDGFHMSYFYGRYLASLVWYATIVGKFPKDSSFIPCEDGEIADKKLIDLIYENVREFLKDR